MAREAARPLPSPGMRDRHESGSEANRAYQLSPEGEAEAKAYWRWCNAYCASPLKAGPDPWDRKPHPDWYYMYL